MSAEAPAHAVGQPTEPPAVPGGVLHGALLRPPVLRWDGQRYGGARLQALDVPAALPGVVEVVRQQHFIGVIAVAAVLARQAAESLRPVWQTPAAAVPPISWPAADEPAYRWQLPARGTHDGAAVTAWCVGGYATVWAPSARADRVDLVAELARLLNLPPGRVTVVEVDPGPLGAAHALDVLDAAADAALLSQAVQRPVRVALQGPSDPATLLLWPVDATAPDGADGAGPASLDQAREGIGDGSSTAWHSTSSWAVRPSLARLLSQPARAEPSGLPTVQAHGNGAAPVLASAGSWLPLAHAASADLDAAQVFAQEVWRDEQAIRAGVDPLDDRLRRLPGGPGRRLAAQMAERAGWQARPFDAEAGRAITLARTGPDGRLHGRGYAAAQVHVRGADGALAEAWSAWVADVAVDAATGRIDVTRVVVGRDGQALHDARAADIQDGDPRWLETARRLLAAPPGVDEGNGSADALEPGAGRAARTEGGTLAHLARGALMDRPADADAAIAHGQIEADGVVTLPAAAAIANAIFDATGVRLRQVPFDGEQLRLALAPAQPSASGVRRWQRLGRGWLAAGAGFVTAAAGLLAMAWPAKPAIAPTDGPDVTLYSAAAIERGRLVAAAGDCVVCHTAPSGTPNAGGLGLETPFGTIYSTNITPDLDTGIGRWSYSAFERAMREGVHRDGRQLYPAFPYTAFAKMTDGDMQALYAYLMTQPPVRSEPPQTALAFPYNLRPAMAGWNLLFHDNRVYQPDPAQSPEWNRGAYLVEGAGHCAACHSPRNALGAEKQGLGHYLAGGQAEGWDAPALDRLASAKVPWTADELYQYLRTGFSARHGVAAGPMAPVIHGLAELPESDVRAITTYLMNLPGSAPASSADATVALASTPDTAGPSAAAVESLPTLAAAPIFQAHVNGERLYNNACAVCHEAGSGPTLFGVKPLLAANTSVHAATPDNLIQVILHGIQAPANGDLGYMPGFGDSLDDAQVAELLGYLRARFAPDQPAWAHAEKHVERVRRHSP